MASESEPPPPSPPVFVHGHSYDPKLHSGAPLLYHAPSEGAVPRPRHQTMALDGPVEEETQLQTVLFQVQTALKTDLGLIEKLIPLQKDNPSPEKVLIFHSPDYHERSRLLIIMSNQYPGIWSRSLISKGVNDSGSMMPYLKKARREGYGVIVLNPAGAADAARLFGVQFKGKTAADVHVEIVWDELVKPLSCDLYVLGYARGGQYVKHLVQYDGGEGALEDRLRAIALIESSHMMTKQDSDFVRSVFSSKATAWMKDDHEIGSLISDKYRLGCTCLSSGPVQAFKDSKNSAWIINQVLVQVFLSFEARFDGERNSSSSSSQRSSKPENTESIERLVGKIKRRLVHDYSFRKYQVPLARDGTGALQQVPLLVTSNYKTSKKILVIFSNSFMGVWSRSALLEGDEGAGSMLQFIQEASSLSFAIIIANFYEVVDVARLSGSMSCATAIDNHIKIIWEDFVSQNPSADLFFFGFSKGGQYLKRFIEVYDRSEELNQRVRAIAFLESSHWVDFKDTYYVRHMLARKAVAWVLSRKPPATKLTDYQRTLGCVTLSAGELSNISGNYVYLMQSVLPMLFGAFLARLGPSVASQLAKKQAGRCAICCKPFKLFTSKQRCSWCRNVCCAYENMEVMEVKHSKVKLCPVCKVLPLLMSEGESSLAASLGLGGGGGREPTEKATKDHQLFNNNNNGTRSAMTSLCIRQPFEDSSTQSTMLDDFEIVKLIGKGACGRVKLVRKKTGKDEGMLYAMKSLRKKRIVELGLVEATKLERRIMSRTNHPYICALRYAFQTESKLYLLLDYYPGGNLLDLLRRVRRRDISAQQIRLYLAEVVSALAHVHQEGIMYRDVKLENVLVGADGHVALTDFGMSKDLKLFGGEDRATTMLGTFQMMAPDILNGKGYTKAVDWWALGCMMFELIGGQLPFRGKNHSEIEKEIRNAPLVFNDRWNGDVAAKDLVMRLLDRNASSRIGSGANGHEDVMSHPYFRDIDWAALMRKEITFPGQEAFAAKHIRPMTTEDVMEVLMASRNVPVDTPDHAESVLESRFSEFEFTRPSLDEGNPEDEEGLKVYGEIEDLATTKQLVENAAIDELEELRELSLQPHGRKGSQRSL